MKTGYLGTAAALARAQCYTVGTRPGAWHPAGGWSLPSSGGPLPATARRSARHLSAVLHLCAPNQLSKRGPGATARRAWSSPPHAALQGAGGRAAPAGAGGKVLVFDINETTLDYAGGLGPVLRGLLGREGAYEEFFRQLILLAHTLTLTGGYRRFGELAPAALQQAAANEAITGEAVDLPEDAWERVRAAMGRLRAHEDVAPGLRALRAQGWRLIALSNSDPEGLGAQLRGAGIYDTFDAVLSVDAVRKYKPAAEVYRYALQQGGVQAAEAVMVAAHDWDLAGARAVGMRTAFVKRHLGFASGVYAAPDVTASDFEDLARQLGPAAR